MGSGPGVTRRRPSGHVPRRYGAADLSERVGPGALLIGTRGIVESRSLCRRMTGETATTEVGSGVNMSDGDRSAAGHGIRPLG